MVMTEEKVVLVDENDKRIGTEEKIKAHKQGKLHRAFSVFVFNSKGELLLQQRAKGKYHSGGLWTNTCCSHPRPAEPIDEAAHRRLMEEMGMECKLKEVGSFIYRAAFENGLIENEFDHVFIGRCDNEPEPDADEVGDYKWINMGDLVEDVETEPEKFTPWLRVILEKHEKGEIRFD